MTAQGEYFSKVDGQVLMSPKAVALIFGVSEQQVIDRLYVSRPGGTVDGELFSADMPMFWVQNGRRRIREAFAAVGREDMAEALSYLARLENGAA